MLSNMGYKAEIKVKKHGFYPVGGAEVFIEKARVAKRQAEAAVRFIYDEIQLSPEIRSFYVDSDSPGSVIALWIKTENTLLGSDWVGERGVKAEEVGMRAARGL